MITWAEWMVGLVMLLYFSAALGYFRTEQYGLMLAYICYGLANIGLMIAAIEGR